MGYAREVMTVHGFRATARKIMDEVLGESPTWVDYLGEPAQGTVVIPLKAGDDIPHSAKHEIAAHDPSG